ncbi:MAG: Lrp/AsnC family transcriptional regulator [Methanosarcinaceae archaeon]|nr:Lrp/AsnC family transcriptional regulator [Methanosarcinaceae archaeon]
MDFKDKKIIEILLKDSRTPFTEIAKELKLSESTIRKRVKVLEEDNVIQKYTLEVDPSKMGYITVAIIGLDVDPSMLMSVALKMTEFKEVKYVSTSTGDHMIMIEVWAKNGKEFMEIISNKIGKVDGINRICPSIILEKMKI